MYFRLADYYGNTMQLMTHNQAPRNYEAEYLHKLLEAPTGVKSYT